MSLSTADALWAFFLAGAIYKAVTFVRAWRVSSVGIPHLFPPFSPFSTPGILLPTSWWNPGVGFVWEWKRHVYERAGNDTFSVHPWLFGSPLVVTSNAEVIRQLTGGSQKDPVWVKPIEALRVTLVWGMNVFAAPGGELWRKHRRALGPAFNNDLYDLVWRGTAETYRQMIEVDQWTKNGGFETTAVHNITAKLALTLIAKCGFGLPFDWETTVASVDEEMSVQTAFQLMSEQVFFRVLMPEFLLRTLPLERCKKVRKASSVLSQFTKEAIQKRRLEVKNEQVNRDILTLLVCANEVEEEKKRLTDTEIIGNIHIFLLGGHETTAHTLEAAIAYLAYHNEIQEEVHQQIVDAVNPDDELSLRDSPKIYKVLSVFYESTRLFPAGFMFLREPAEDTVIRVPRPRSTSGASEETNDMLLPVPRKTWAVIDIIGMNRNPRYFEDPHEFKPSRWYNASKSDKLPDFLGSFGSGARECIGRKFATTEAVCFLAHLLREWRIEPLLKEGECKETWKERTFSGKVGFNLCPSDVAVRFVRRER